MIFRTRATFWRRASARETTARVAVGALAKALLAELGVQVLSHVIAVGEQRLHRAAEWEELVELSQRDEVLLGCVDPEAEQRMKARGRRSLSHR